MPSSVHRLQDTRVSLGSWAGRQISDSSKCMEMVCVGAGGGGGLYSAFQASVGPAQTHDLLVLGKQILRMLMSLCIEVANVSLQLNP